MERPKTSFEEFLEPIHDECMSGMGPGYYEPSMAVPQMGDFGVLPDLPPVLLPGDGGQQGVKRSYCQSSLSSLTTPQSKFPCLLDDDIDSDFEEDLLNYLSPQANLPGSTSGPPQLPLVTFPPPINHHCPPQGEVIVDSATRTEPITPSGTNTNNSQHQPTALELELKIGYENHGSKIVNLSSPDGFILFHERTPDPSILPKDCRFIRFPHIEPVSCNTEGDAIPTHDSKCAKYVRKILANMEGGLQVRWNGDCLYARRWSKAKIFYKSYETRASDEVIELPRGKETMVFNFAAFQDRVRGEYIQMIDPSSGTIDRAGMDKKLAQEMNPTVYFSFAQKWAPQCHQLKSCLVWAALKLCSASHQYGALFHTKHRSLDDQHSGLLQFSTDRPSLNGMG